MGAWHFCCSEKKIPEQKCKETIESLHSSERAAGRARLGEFISFSKIIADLSCPDNSDIESQNHLGGKGP